jgi:hypothetical protein
MTTSTPFPSTATMGPIGAGLFDMGQRGGALNFGPARLRSSVEITLVGDCY